MSNKNDDEDCDNCKSEWPEYFFYSVVAICILIYVLWTKQ